MKKESIKFYFSVEGATESWYLEWLENTINSSDPVNKVKIDCQVNQHPFSYVKTLSTLGKQKLEITHLMDVESKNLEHTTKFHSALGEMKDAKTQRRVTYNLGYSNFTFELWMILHKKDCNGHLKNRKQYLGHINKAFGTKYKSLTDYKKEDEFKKKILAQLTLDDVRAAIARAKEIMKKNEENRSPKTEYKGYTYYINNPALSIWETIEKILDACKV